MFEEILLEDEQKKLLSILVEAVCNTPPDQRQQFVFTKSFEESLLEHPGLAEGGRKVYKGDVEFLADEKLIALSPRSNNSLMFDVIPRGFKYYKEMKQSLDQPTRNIENIVRDYLAAEHFQQRYPESYQKWTAAEALLWKSDSDSQLTMIGHLCREAMQEFATALVSKYQPPGINENKANTVARIRAVINLGKDRLGKVEKEFLEVLLPYWGMVSDLTQRQEHGGQKEGQPLVWEDGRRVVFQSALVMFELDRSLFRHQ